MVENIWVLLIISAYLAIYAISDAKSRLRELANFITKKFGIDYSNAIQVGLSLLISAAIFFPIHFFLNVGYRISMAACGFTFGVGVFAWAIISSSHKDPDLSEVEDLDGKGVLFLFAGAFFSLAVFSIEIGELGERVVKNFGTHDTSQTKSSDNKIGK